MITFLITMLVTFTFGMERPHICIAQGLVESGMNKYAVGDRGESKGAFQVQAKHWGKVPRGLLAQANQNERILEELLQESGQDYSTAISRYNGAGKPARQYAKEVRRVSLELALLEVNY